MKESLASSYVSMANQSEDCARRHYNRTVYDSALCKEITNASLMNTEGALRILQGVLKVKEDVMIDATNKEDGQDAIVKHVEELVFKTKYLRREVDNLGGIVEVMEQVGLLDQSQRIAAGEIQGICTDFNEVNERRSHFDTAVRNSIGYYPSTYASIREYEGKVTFETERRMQVTGTTASTVLAAVVSTLRREGVLNHDPHLRCTVLRNQLVVQPTSSAAPSGAQTSTAPLPQ